MSLDNRIGMDPTWNMLSSPVVKLRLKTVTQTIVVLQTHKLYPSLFQSHMKGGPFHEIVRRY